MPGTMGNNLPFVDLGKDLLATTVSSYYHGCAIITDGRLKCWGQGTFGALGTGASDSLGDGPGEMGDLLKAIDLGKNHTAKQVATAVWTTCAILDDDSAKCWGWNSNGWLGQGRQERPRRRPGRDGRHPQADRPRQGPQGPEHRHRQQPRLRPARRRHRQVLGQQAEGNLGNGLAGFGAVGDGPGEMGDVLKPLDFGKGRTVKQLGARRPPRLRPPRQRQGRAGVRTTTASSAWAT
ncbi:RCC1 domain-containing protein [Nannocystis sp.]|uniref:RCC1 domain-containing protein n=1 Tax=Nannocystis sp. TaxID=1962667 RepID=UPI0025E836F7|nr:RCC1 domain-containing protein [Nannocystis sp.]